MSNVTGSLYNVSGTNIPNMLAPFNTSCVVTSDYNVSSQNINYSFEPNTRGLKDYIDVDSSYWAPTTNGFKAGEDRPDDSREEVEIRVRFKRDERSLTGIDDLKVPSSRGQIPISSFIKIIPAAISHKFKFF